MAGDASRRNGRRGGRPKGRKSAATLEREAVLAAVRQRVLANADRIVNAQLALAEGCAFLFRRGKGKQAKTETVADAATIRRFLDGELSEDDGYFYIHTERPSNFAADSLFNRVFGRPTEQVELSGPERGPLGPITVVIRGREA